VYGVDVTAACHIGNSKQKIIIFAISSGTISGLLKRKILKASTNKELDKATLE
jgi:hypothetical protein